MDRLQCMMSFIRVVERGSFAAAAEGTGLSPTMIGNHVRFLEGRLGGLLLNRTTRRQSLTDLGQGYYQRCVRILQDVEDAEAEASALQSVPRGLLRISAPLALGSGILPQLIAEYLKANSEVEIDLALSDRVVDLIAEGFDVAVRVGELPDSNLVGRKLTPFRIVLCASPDYLARHRTPVVPSDLANHSCLDFTLSSLNRHWVFADGTSITPRGCFRSNNGDALRRAALEGLGIIMVPELLVQPDVKAGRLVALLPDQGPPPRAMTLLYPPDRRPTAVRRSFVAFMAEELGGGGARDN